MTISNEQLLSGAGSAPVKRALVMGFFSTVGDLECLEIVRQWLGRVGIPHDVAPYGGRVRERLAGALDPRVAPADVYTHLIVVCGPCWREFFRKEGIDLSRFDHCVRIGVNLTMVEPPSTWNPFDVLIERDSVERGLPDLTFLAGTALWPVIGRCVVREQKEYGSRQRHEDACRAIDNLIVRRNFAVIDVDTRWPHPADPGGLQSASNVVSILGRVDFLITSRLHGLVYALKAGVPALVIDPIAGGDKISMQAKTIGWPKVVLAEDVDSARMDAYADWCLSGDARAAVQLCREKAVRLLENVGTEFNSALRIQKAQVARKQSRTFWDWFR